MKATLTLAAVALALLACGSQPGPATAGRTKVPPIALSLLQPAYPEEARKAGAQGTAMVEVTVGADGVVLGCSLTASSGNTLLDDAAVGAAQSSKFGPGTTDGKPVEMKVRVPFRFKLGDKTGEQRGEESGGSSWARHEPGFSAREV